MASLLNSELTAKAISELFKFQEKKEAESGKQSLVGFYAKPILAQVQLKEVIKKSVIRPVRVNIPNSLFSVDGEDHSVCLFCRSEDKTAIDEYLSENPVEGLTKVVSINEVRKLYKAYKDIKKLLSEHTHFLCDESILTQLYNLLGKTFADRNNAPIPVSYKSPSKIHGAMVKAVSSSYIHLKGQTITIRLGLLSMSESDVIANTLEGLDFAIGKLKGGWNDVSCIHLKTSDSPALPIYNKTDSEMMKGGKEEEKVEIAVAASSSKKVKAKKAEAKPVEAKTTESKIPEAKTTEVKTAKAKTAKAKAVEAEIAVAEIAEVKAADTVNNKKVKAKTASAVSSSKKAKVSR